MKYDRIKAAEELEIGASAFKAKCLDILKRLGDRKLARVVVTRHGKPVAEIYPPNGGEAAIVALHGAMRGSVSIPDDFDLTAPVLDEPLDAEQGILHR